jgi:hypothetical protein
MAFRHIGGLKKIKFLTVTFPEAGFDTWKGLENTLGGHG